MGYHGGPQGLVAGGRGRTAKPAHPGEGATRASARAERGPKALDQETAVRLEQRHTCSGRHQCGRGEGREGPRHLGSRCKVGGTGKLGRMRRGPPGDAADPRGLLVGQCLPGGRRGPAARHPAGARNLAVAKAAANARARVQKLNRLHPHEGGACDGEQEPGRAFHCGRHPNRDQDRGAIPFALARSLA